MANIKSSKKRNETNELKRQRNVAVKSRMKTYVKEAMAAIEGKDAAKVKTLVPAALAEIDRAASKGIIHRNSASRKKSTLQRAVGAI
jgi:small subunit ribosomal protein S20